MELIDELKNNTKNVTINNYYVICLDITFVIVILLYINGNNN